MIIRPIALKDLAQVAAFSSDSMMGMTSVPRHKNKLEEKIIHSENCFLEDIKSPGMEEYYFVLEDISKGQVGGISGIMAENSLSRSNFYQIETLPNTCFYPFAAKDQKVLKVVSNATKASEICSLYLESSFRHSGQGRLLSLSRFLFMAAHLQRFENEIVVELRGNIDDQQRSPFWDAVGSHFCHLTFAELMAQLEIDSTFISDILPRYPIYIDLLPKAAQEVIGKTHKGSQPALSMLFEEGFHLTNRVDLFDAGPTLSAHIQEIRTIKMSSVVTITVTADSLENEKDYLIGNERIDFRACLGKIKLTAKSEAMINKKMAEALQVKTGDKIRFVSVH